MNPIKYSWANIQQQRKRALLTVIGIMIGIAAVVALISLGQGLEDSINEQFEAIGADKLFIQNRGQFGGSGEGGLQNSLTDEDVEVVENTNGVRNAAGVNVQSVEVRFNDQLGFYFGAGISTQNEEDYELIWSFFTLEIAEGRELREGDENSVVIGADYARREIFAEPLQLGERIEIQGQQFTVAGIAEPLGNPVDDKNIYMSQEALRDLLDVDDSVYAIVAQVDTGDDVELIAENVERELLDFRGLDEDERDFTVQTPEDLLASFGNILLIIRVVLIGIAAISLLVGGINIMNTMYTSVLERTKEIGIMKAIGATPRTIKGVFLSEAAILGLIGGALGIIVGLGLSLSIEAIAAQALNADLLQAYTGWPLIVAALGFSIIVGMTSGYFPARQASKQNAVDSLRYE